MGYRVLLQSELKQKVLLSLLKGDKKLQELKVDIGTTETTILHTLKEFENLNLTVKSSGCYRLSSLGLIEAQICDACNGATETLQRFKDFWLTHNVNPIPASMFLKMGYLNNATLIKTESSQLDKVHQTFMQFLVNSNRVRGTAPIFHSDYLSAFKGLLHSGGTVELICSGQVLKKILESIRSAEDAKLFQESMANRHLRIYLNDDLKLALTITESIFSLGLFDLNGEYDYNMDLISSDPRGLQWGEEVFQSYLANSVALEGQELGKG